MKNSYTLDLLPKLPCRNGSVVSDVDDPDDPPVHRLLRRRRSSSDLMLRTRNRKKNTLDLLPKLPRRNGSVAEDQNDSPRPRLRRRRSSSDLLCRNGQRRRSPLRLRRQNSANGLMSLPRSSTIKRSDSSAGGSDISQASARKENRRRSTRRASIKSNSSGSKLSKDTTKERRKKKKEKKEKKEKKHKDKKEQKRKSLEKCDTTPRIPQLRRHRSASDLKALLQESEASTKVRSSADSLCLYEEKKKEKKTSTSSTARRRRHLRRVRSANDMKTLAEDCSVQSAPNLSINRMRNLMHDGSDGSAPKNRGCEALPTLKQLLATAEDKRIRAHQGRQPQDTSDMPSLCNYQSGIDSSCQTNHSEDPSEVSLACPIPSGTSRPIPFTFSSKDPLAVSKSSEKSSEEDLQETKDALDLMLGFTKSFKQSRPNMCNYQLGLDSSCQTNYSEATSATSSACPLPVAPPTRETSLATPKKDPLAVSQSEKSTEDDLKKETEDDDLDLMLGLPKPQRPDNTSSFMSRSMSSDSSDSSFSLGSEDISCLMDLSRRSEYSLMRLSVKGVQAEQRRTSSSHRSSRTRTIPVEAPPAPVVKAEPLPTNTKKEDDLDAKSHDMDASEYLSCFELEDDLDSVDAIEHDIRLPVSAVPSRTKDGMVITTGQTLDLDMSILMDQSVQCGGKSVHSSSTATTHAQSKNSNTSGMVHVMPTTTEASTASGGSSSSAHHRIITTTLTPTSTWKCGLCTTENEDCYKFCGMCAHPRFWTCAVCKFEKNKSQFPHCGGCGSRRNQRPLVATSPLNSMSMAVPVGDRE